METTRRVRSGPPARLRTDVISAILRERGWKLEDLATHAQVGYNSVCRFMRGEDASGRIVGFMLAFPNYTVRELFDLGDDDRVPARGVTAPETGKEPAA